VIALIVLNFFPKVNSYLVFQQSQGRCVVIAENFLYNIDCYWGVVSAEEHPERIIRFIDIHNLPSTTSGLKPISKITAKHIKLIGPG